MNQSPALARSIVRSQCEPPCLRRMWALLQLHAKQCNQPNCPVPRCPELRLMKRRQLARQEEKRRQGYNHMLRQQVR